MLIVGAGLSGIGAACHLRAPLPGHELRDRRGSRGRSAARGTCSATPGIRSDSDMFTLGYSFRPWKEPKAIADGPSIRAYVREAAPNTAIEDRIRFQHRVVGAEWSSERRALDRRARSAPTRRARARSPASFLFGCTGYYRYDEGFTPRFRGHRAVRRDDRPPAALARGPRLRGQARGRDRQRRDRRHARPGDGRDGRARDDAAALAQLRAVAAGHRPLGRASRAGCCRGGRRMRSCAGRTCCWLSACSRSAAGGRTW